MSRKRTPDQETNTSDQATPESATAVTEQPATEPGTDRPGFAERVGQKKRPSTPDPFLIATDVAAGVRLFESKQDKQMAIKFGDGGLDAKPSEAVLDVLREAGYHWKNPDRIWAYPVQDDSALRTRIEAEQLYQEIRQMIREEKGITQAPEVPF